MKNTSHILIGLSCLIVAGAVAYYVLTYLPAKNQLAHQKECQTMSLNRFEQDKLNSKEHYLNQPEFAFDSENNRCLYKTHATANFTGDSVYKTYDFYRVLDLYTNREIVKYHTKVDGDGKVVTEGDQDGFNEINEVYFSN
jgi:hypothetical protein